MNEHKNQPIKISCIVPVYNEGARVKNVLDALIASNALDEIIVIDDGSSDDSEEVLQKITGIKLISLAVNGGKSHAVKVGFEAARNDFVMMIDSDLIGLTPDSFAHLVEPIENGSADMSISTRKNSLGLYKFLGLDFISGERVFNKSIIKNLEDLDGLPGFGLESFINKIVVAEKLRLKVVKWDNVISPRKSAKQGMWMGMKGDAKMIKEIVRYLGLWGTIRIYIDMLALRV